VGRIPVWTNYFLLFPKTVGLIPAGRYEFGAIVLDAAPTAADVQTAETVVGPDELRDRKTGNETE